MDVPKTANLKMELRDESGFDSRPNAYLKLPVVPNLKMELRDERAVASPLWLWMHHGDGCFILTAASSVLAGLNNHLRFRAILMWWITQVDLLFLD